jgi:hypothetical protein
MKASQTLADHALDEFMLLAQVFITPPGADI